MLVKVSYIKVDALAWHAWLDKNAPTWSIKSYEWQGDAAGSEQPTREHAEWLYAQFIKFQTMSDNVGLSVIYDIEDDIAMIARLTWVITPIRNGEDDQP